MFCYKFKRNIVSKDQILNNNISTVSNKGISKIIIQTFRDSVLEEYLKNNVDMIKNLNPTYEYLYFSDNDCIQFLQHYFNPIVYQSYCLIKPGAFKADLFRYCALYIFGGIYLDIKLNCTNGFKLIELTENEHYVVDRVPNGIFNSLMVCKKGNAYLLKCIQQIVQNVKNRFYGNSPLHPTGPVLLGLVAIRNNYKINTDMIHYQDGGFIIYKNRFVISTEYPEYNTERTNTYKSIKTERYDSLWNKRQIYK
jgi:mannosyltransferase OCH1-like enzyme